MTPDVLQNALMTPVRLQKTLADYVAIAISPILIMLLVGSFSFFIYEISGTGTYATGAWWILFWFVFAIVLVARIGIEQGKRHAAGYAAALALATGFVVDSWQGLVFLLCVWWYSSRLTWDCTLIDESRDSSGQGLLAVVGMNAAEPLVPSGVSKKGDSRKSKWKFWSRSKQQDGTHSAGLWLICFAGLALPVFGVGHILNEGFE